MIFNFDSDVFFEKMHNYVVNWWNTMKCTKVAHDWIIFPTELQGIFSSVLMSVYNLLFAWWNANNCLKSKEITFLDRDSFYAKHNLTDFIFVHMLICTWFTLCTLHYTLGSAARWHLWKILRFFSTIWASFCRKRQNKYDGVHYVISSALCSMHLVKIFIS